MGLDLRTMPLDIEKQSFVELIGLYGAMCGHLSLAFFRADYDQGYKIQHDISLLRYEILAHFHKASDGLA